MITLNVSALGPVLLVLVLSLVLGVVASLLSKLAGFAFELLFGIVQIIAGAGSPSKNQKSNKAFIGIRAVVYTLACVAAIAASMMGHQAIAYACAVFGGVCLPIAVGKIIE